MYPRVNYQLSEEDMKTLLEACKPTPAMMIGSYVVPSPQENANRAWERLGKKMGFNHKTVRPIPGKGQRYFSAIPSENEAQRKERLKNELEEKRQAKIKKLRVKIQKLQEQLNEITG